MVGSEPCAEDDAACFNYSPECPVLHVVVVGFHHKKGCQVEYAHPPLIPGGDSFSPELPSPWRTLPPLALRYAKDAVRTAATRDLCGTIDRETELQMLCTESEDALEGIKAFIHRRDPVFKGR